MFIMQVLASQLHFLANRNAGMAIPPLFRPVNCIKIGGHVALLSCPTVHSLYCDSDPISATGGLNIMLAKTFDKLSIGYTNSATK